MRWRRGQQSDYVQDRRGLRVGGGTIAGGGGIVGIIVLLIAMFAGGGGGIDITDIIGQLRRSTGRRPPTLPPDLTLRQVSRFARRASMTSGPAPTDSA